MKVPFSIHLEQHSTENGCFQILSSYIEITRLMINLTSGFVLFNDIYSNICVFGINVSVS